MNYYEILYIVNPNLERKKIDDIMKEIESRLKKTKSKIINHVIWGKKKLAYPIQGNKYGTYMMAHYEGGDRTALDEFNAWLKLSELVIRHMIVRLDEEPAVVEKTEDNLNLSSQKEESADAGEKELNKKEATKEASEEAAEEAAEETEGVE